MDVAEVERWYAFYVSDFAAVVRGDIDDARHLLSYYALPLLVSSVFVSLLGTPGRRENAVGSPADVGFLPGT